MKIRFIQILPLACCLLSNLMPLCGQSQPELFQARREIDVSLLASPDNDVTLLASPDSGILRAVVIGVGAFQSSDIPPLPIATAEASRFADSLQRAGATDADHIKLLTDQKATAGQIAFTLDWLLEASQAGDQALIYFNGYWATEQLTKNRQDYFIAWDAPPRVFMAGGTFPAHYLDDVILSLQEAQVQVRFLNQTTVQIGPFKE